MGDYDPRGSTDDYGDQAGSVDPPEGDQTVVGGDGHPVPSSDDRMLAMFAHLGGLVVWWITGGILAWVVPLAIWLSKKDDSEFVADQAKEALNFQLTALIFPLIMGFIGIILVIVTLGLGICIILPLFLLFGLYVLVFGIIAALKAHDGERYRYPFCFRLIQ